MSRHYDIAIVGSGFAGSLAAMIARRLGLSVILIEKGTHPRVVIGESSTPLSNLLLEEIGWRYDLPVLSDFAKWGSWQRTHPEVACGLKRGFTFHHHVLGQPKAPHQNRLDQLLVAASPRDEIADTHWYRADFDQFLLRQAQQMGADYIDEVSLNAFLDGGETATLEGERHSKFIAFEARFVIDATGPRGFLHRALALGEREQPGLPSTQALYNHFTGVQRLAEGSASRTPSPPPYPIDDAAVHHVFDGGWIWVLQFNNGVTSAGVAATHKIAAELGLADGPAAWDRLLHLIPALREQFQLAKPQRAFTHLPKLGFRSEKIAGHRWAMLPSAAGFVDPLLSTGFPLTLLGVRRLGEILERDWNTPRFAVRLRAYAESTDAELVAASRLIGALYNNMHDFPIFVSLSMLYFAAVSFSETARRLGKPELAPSFLLRDHPVFGPASCRILERAHSNRTKAQSEELEQDILETIEPFNVAGFGDAKRRNWYPVNAEDLLSSAHKLNVSRTEIEELLQRCGFTREPEPTSLVALYS